MDYENLYLKHFEYKTEKIMENEKLSWLNGGHPPAVKLCGDCSDFSRFCTYHEGRMKYFCYKCIRKFDKCVNKNPAFSKELDDCVKKNPELLQELEKLTEN